MQSQSPTDRGIAHHRLITLKSVAASVKLTRLGIFSGGAQLRGFIPMEPPAELRSAADKRPNRLETRESAHDDIAPGPSREWSRSMDKTW